MLLQNPFVTLCTNGVDAVVFEVMTRSTADYTLSQIHNLQRGTASRTALRASLNRLVEHGIILENLHGKTYSYELCREHLLYEPLQQIASTKNRLFKLLTEDIEAWPTQPLTVQLFGSAARSEMEVSSDIDIFIVAPDEWNDAEMFVNQLATRASHWTGNDVRPLFYYENELADEPILRNIANEGIEIAGTRRWLSAKLRTLRSVA